jgi:1-acyl-sn-glycerol-3-phosphate acyltransferase
MRSSPIILLRSALFNLCFFAWSMLTSLIFAPFFILSSQASSMAGAPWAKGTLILARAICGIRYEIRGSEFIRDEPIIYASKHQSAWDTAIFLTLFTWPAYVLKESLLRIPLWGWYLWRMKMIAIDRSAGASSIKHMLKQARQVLADRRPIVIYPEGTRTRPGDPPHYHPGTVALYNQLGVPVVPVALNSGCYWGKNAFLKYPGVIVIEFLPPIPPGLSKDEFRHQLQTTIETASQRLLDEAKSAQQAQ